MIKWSDVSERYASALTDLNLSQSWTTAEFRCELQEHAEASQAVNVMGQTLRGTQNSERRF